MLHTVDMLPQYQYQPRTLPVEWRARRDTGLRRRRRQGTLHRLDVADIRRWSRTDGQYLSLSDQIRAMQPYYRVSETALRELLLNKSWYDPTYTPIDFPEVSGLTPAVCAHPLLCLCVLFLMTQARVA